MRPRKPLTEPRVENGAQKKSGERETALSRAGPHSRSALPDEHLPASPVGVHAHPRLVRVIRREAGRAIHLSNLFQNPLQAPLARKLVEWSGLDRVFFTNS